MSRINVLGFDVANLIAAGEVVDRPASVVKELLENAVDSGADEITVEIRNGGISHIRVSDNGCGMDADDLPLAVLRHATSKIKNASDLDSISTLGFRGEALAAIAAVTRLKIYSRPHKEDIGTLMVCEGGEILELCEAGCAKGTTVIADELFFNVPARRKFLKRDATECAKITEIVERVALSVPDISVKYICDGEIRFMTQGDGELLNSIHGVFGKQTASRMLKVSRSENGVSVSGYISEADLTFSKRTQEIFYVNGRYIKSPLLMSALERAYVSKIPSDKFPMCVLNVEISAGAVDVNVHPTKLEVKFSNERTVAEALHYAVLTALNSSESRPEMKFGRTYSGDYAPTAGVSPDRIRQVMGAFAPVETPKKDRDKQLGIPIEYTAPKTEDKKAYDDQPFSANIKNSSGVSSSSNDKKDRCKTVFENVSGISSLLAGYDIPDMEKKAESSTDIDRESGGHEGAYKAENTESKSGKVNVENGKPDDPAISSGSDNYKISLVSSQNDEIGDIPDFKIIGEAYDCYIIVELEDRLLIIDKHAAHERIIFDELCERRKNKIKESQYLIAPLEVMLVEEQILSLAEYQDDLRTIGFEFDCDVKRRTAMIKAIPSEISTDSAPVMFTSILERLSEGKGTVESTESEFFEKALYQASCKAAIKGGKYYGSEHIRWICSRILKKPDADGKVIKTCPHGRPVAFEIKKTSVERQFSRLE